VKSFLVESYCARLDAHTVATLRRAASGLEDESRGIRHLASVVLAADEICFHAFLAPSATVLYDASKRAQLANERVVEAIWIPADSGGG
jgi:hypothetical protein